MEYEEPSSYSEAVTCKERDMWITAMQEELASPEKNATWILVPKPTT